MQAPLSTISRTAELRHSSTVDDLKEIMEESDSNKLPSDTPPTCNGFNEEDNEARQSLPISTKLLNGLVETTPPYQLDDFSMCTN